MAAAQRQHGEPWEIGQYAADLQQIARWIRAPGARKSAEDHRIWIQAHKEFSAGVVVRQKQAGPASAALLEALSMARVRLRPVGLLVTLSESDVDNH
jgi:hypothetical protein